MPIKQRKGRRFGIWRDGLVRYTCIRGVCSRGVECFEECQRYVDIDPEDYLARLNESVSDEEADRIADKYFADREAMLERNLP
jgi:hypothetical protein